MVAIKNIANHGQTISKLLEKLAQSFSLLPY